MTSPTEQRSFVSNFLHDYKVAAFSESSGIVIQRVLSICDANARIVIEQGAGNGVLTRALLAHLSKESRLIVIEQNADFLATLRALSDPRLTVVEGDVEHFDYNAYLKNGELADLVVSSVPFSFLLKEGRIAVCAAAYVHLCVGGKMIIFHQYSTLMKDILCMKFSRVRTHFVIRNIFPCFVMVGEKVAE